MFRIKICGITNVDDARTAISAGADAIGLNFYGKSPRCVSVQQAVEICSAIKGRAECIGVFVNHSLDEIIHATKDANLDGVQLHGDESPSMVAQLSKLLTPPLTVEETAIVEQFAASAEDALVEDADVDRLSEKASEAQQSLRKKIESTKVAPVIRARRMTNEGVAAIAADLEACRDAGGTPSAVLVDAFTPGRYGGTGETVSWPGLSDYRKWLGEVPLILAGGLTPDNVMEAIRIVRPYGVDVSSGVEANPGKKEPEKVVEFVSSARLAL